MRRMIAVLGAALLAAPVAAQEARPLMVDRVVAVVGDSMVLATEVEEDLLQLRAAGRLPADTSGLRHQLLDQRVEELVLLQAALRDSVQADPAQIQSSVDRDLAQRRQAFGTEEAFQQALEQQGLSLPEYRDRLYRQFARTLTIQRYLGRLQQQRTPPPVTEAEIRAFFEERRAQLGQRPATVSFRQVVLSPQPTDSARQAARAEADRLVQQLVGGANFEELARRHSDDPASADRGGNLGWFRRGEMVTEFENVAFGLPPGAISGVVESPFGFHIIQVEKTRGPERQARHILIRPEADPSAAARVRELAERVAAELRAGASVDTLIARHGDAREQARVGPYPVEQLPAPYDQALASVEVGQVVGPIELPDADVKLAVVKVTEVTEAGEFALDDIRSRIREQLEQQKLVEEILAELKRRTYVDIRL